MLSTLWDHFLRALHYAFEDIAKVKQADIAEFVFMLEELRETHLIGMSDQDRKKLAEIVDSIRQRAFSVYSMKTTDVFSEDAANEVEPLLTILDWVEKQAKIYKKRFPSKILEYVSSLINLRSDELTLRTYLRWAVTSTSLERSSASRCRSSSRISRMPTPESSLRCWVPRAYPRSSTSRRPSTCTGVPATC